MADKLTKIELPANILFLGKTGSGKTYAFKKLYQIWKSKIKLTYLISTTAKYSGDFDGIIPDQNILSDMTLAQGKIAEIAEFAKSQKLRGVSYPIMLVIDDCLGVLDFTSHEFSNLFAISRHINLTIVLMMQNLTKYMGPTLRNNLGYIFVNRISDSNIKCLLGLTDHWSNEQELKRYLSENLVNYQTVFIDKKAILPGDPVVFRA